MPRKQTISKAKRDLQQGKSPTTAAGEFVREEIEHVREGKHGARSPKQAIAIGLSKARRAGVPLVPPAKGQASEPTRRSAERAYQIGQGKRKPRAASAKRSAATIRALELEPKSSVSRGALSRQAKATAARRKRSTKVAGRGSRSAAAANGPGTRSMKVASARGVRSTKVAGARGTRSTKVVTARSTRSSAAANGRGTRTKKAAAHAAVPRTRRPKSQHRARQPQRLQAGAS